MMRWYDPKSKMGRPMRRHDFAGVIERLIRQIKNPYHPERHYMRG